LAESAGLRKERTDLMESGKDIDLLCINTIRALVIDAIEAAKSGHPGAPMGMAPVAYTLWTRFMRYNPKNPDWPGRDRFVLSAGHASMLLYGLLYLTGYDLPLDEIKSFRQLESCTPGHPESGCAPGVEVTTGPLGQGISNAVGMALARELIAARFNRPGYDLTDYYIYVMASDGDLMEGVASEACSLAGHLGLGHLICLYDDNRITIEGPTELSFTEDVRGRFRAYGWYVSSVPDANDIEAVSVAIDEARRQELPALIAIRSKIACGSPNLEGSEEAHGAPLGPGEAVLTKRNIGCPEDEVFHVPEEVLEQMRRAIERGRGLEEKWEEASRAYAAEYPELSSEWERVLQGRLPADWRGALPAFAPGKKTATREASGKVLEGLAPAVPELIGGSADLAPSNRTYIKGYKSVRKGDFSGRNIHFGVREHGMAAIMNGMARHGGIIPYGGTFLVFSDYMRPAIRLAAMMGLKVIYVFTHDSLGVGEDGPTHQPVEQLAALRAIPGLTVIRPADANETSAAWSWALAHGGPVCLILSRQGLPVLDRENLAPASGLLRGAYILVDAPGKPDISLIATGSEVSLALGARDKLLEDGIKVRVISMPSWEIFDEQEEEYRLGVLPPELTVRVSVEAGVTQGWQKYVGDRGISIGVDRFGVSAPGEEAMAWAGFTAENVIEKAKSLLV
jgi:transketolase